MKAPFFLNESGNVLVFRSIEEAERYIEPIDVINREYIGYDSIGRRLQLLVADANRVKIQSAEIEPEHTDELKEVLTRFLSLVGVSQSWLLDAPLEKLVAKMLELGST